MEKAPAPAAELMIFALICLVLGLSFTAAGVVETALSSLLKGAALMAVGCYVTAASALALHRGRAALWAFRPAAATAFASLATLALAGGL